MFITWKNGRSWKCPFVSCRQRQLLVKWCGTKTSWEICAIHQNKVSLKGGREQFIVNLYCLVDEPALLVMHYIIFLLIMHTLTYYVKITSIIHRGEMNLYKWFSLNYFPLHHYTVCEHSLSTYLSGQ